MKNSTFAAWVRIGRDGKPKPETYRSRSIARAAKTDDERVQYVTVSIRARATKSSSPRPAGG